MKILTINTRYIGGGGAAYIAHMIHEEVNKSELYSSIFLYGRGKGEEKDSKKIIYPKMEYLSALSFRLVSKEFNLNKNIEQQIKECDIVHLHNIHGYYIDYSHLFEILKKYNKKVIWTLHDMWAITGRCAYSFNCEKWKKECGNCENKRLYPATIIDRSKKELELKKKVILKLNKENMIIVTPSKWLKQICEESYLNKFRIESISNGIPNIEMNLSKETLREKYNIEKNKKVILFVAADTNDERKGIKYILDVIKRSSNYIFISIGKKMRNINYDNLKQFGYIDEREKINEIYSLADVFVIPSLDDNFPTTIIESFANGVPVIGFKVGGIPEMIDSKVGIVVENIDSNELKEAIDKMLNNQRLLQKYSENSRKKYIENYTKNVFIEKYKNIYKLM